MEKNGANFSGLDFCGNILPSFGSGNKLKGRLNIDAPKKINVMLIFIISRIFLGYTKWQNDDGDGSRFHKCQ